MQSRTRLGLQVLGAVLVLVFGFLVWRVRSPAAPVAAGQGEEVYASHDCTDCHLAAPVLAQKKARKEPGLIRNRKDMQEIIRFLETDNRHRSFLLISPEDRKNLVEYLRTLAGF